MDLKSKDTSLPTASPLGKQIITVKGFPKKNLLGLWLPTELDLAVGDAISSLPDLSGNGHNAPLVTGAQVPVYTSEGLETVAAGNGFMFNTGIPWGGEFTFVGAFRIAKAVSAGFYPSVHQSSSSFQTAGMGASNPQTGVTINVQHEAAAALVSPAMFSNNAVSGGTANFGGTPRKGASLAAADRLSWFIAAWSYKPSTDQFTFRAKAAGAILGNTSTDAITAAYMEAFGGSHCFGLARFATTTVNGEFHGATMYDVAKDAAGIDDLIMRMVAHMHGDGITTV